MAKFFGALGWVGLSLLVVGMQALPSTAQDPFGDVTPGICRLPFRAGRMVVTTNGQLMNLPDYCAQSQSNFSQPVTEPVDLSSESDFWQAFVTAASPSALEFAESIGQDKVTEYGTSICAALRDGQSLDELRQTQADGRTSVAFEAAVTVASVNTNCPEFRSQLGRFSSDAAKPAAPPP
jgi:Protein of unknown function (DUF732)